MGILNDQNRRPLSVLSLPFSDCLTFFAHDPSIYLLPDSRNGVFCRSAMLCGMFPNIELYRIRTVPRPLVHSSSSQAKSTQWERSLSRHQVNYLDFCRSGPCMKTLEVNEKVSCRWKVLRILHGCFCRLSRVGGKWKINPSHKVLRCPMQYQHRCHSDQDNFDHMVSTLAPNVLEDDVLPATFHNGSPYT